MEEGCRYMRTAQLSVVMISLPPVRYSEGSLWAFGGVDQQSKTVGHGQGSSTGWGATGKWRYW